MAKTYFQAQFENDLDVLNYALTLEHLEATFYDQVNASGVLDGDAASYLQIIGEHERSHVDALTGAISDAGGTPVAARASYNFDALGDLSTQEGILQVSMTLESTGVGAYNGAASFISDKNILATAASIVQSEARHTALVRALIDDMSDPVPDSGFAPVTAPQDVLDAVTPILGPEQ